LRAPPKPAWQSFPPFSSPFSSERLVQPVDDAFEPGGLLRPHAQPLPGGLAGRLRHAQVGADVEQIVLDAAQQLRLRQVGVLRQQ
jgi:hypothetical protein